MADKVLAREGRVKIRRFKRADIADRANWPPYTNSLFTHLNLGLGTFVEREKWFFTRKTGAGRMYFAIEDENARLIGEMSLRDVDSYAKAARLGIHLASDKVALGYGREALTALMSHYFCTMRWNVMLLDVAAFNRRAIALYERLHFEHLAPFWRRVIVDDHVMTDPAHAAIRRFLRRASIGIEALHYDMALPKERYFATLAPARAAQTPGD